MSIAAIDNYYFINYTKVYNKFNSYVCSKTMNIIVTTSVLLAVAVSLGSCVKICPNPESYAFKVVCDAAGNQCGECVSFVKVCTRDVIYCFVTDGI